MKKLHQSGALDVFVLPLILMTLLFISAGSFGLWAFLGRQDYKQNVDQKVAAAVDVAKKEVAAVKDVEFAEKEKLPLKDYKSPAAFSSIVVQYPKTWSAYVNDKGNSTNPVDGYFHPVFVPGVDSVSIYALRVQLVDQPYAQEVKRYEGQIKSGIIRAAPYSPAKVQTIVGMRLDGELESQKNGAMVIVPVRDKTLKIWTESQQFINDFNTIILPNYSFEP